MYSVSNWIARKALRKTISLLYINPRTVTAYQLKVRMIANLSKIAHRALEDGDIFAICGAIQSSSY